MIFLRVTVFFTAILCFSDISFSEDTMANNRPIIGILSEELTDKMTQNYGPHKSFIASSNVQFVHGAGARAVPILIGQDREYYEQLLRKINGVLLPGGSVWFDNKTEGYVEAGRWILEEADKMNKEGDYFPIWGTCLGYELMALIQNNDEDLRVNCSAYNTSNSLSLTPEAKDSRLFLNATPSFLEILTKKNATSNFHRFCITSKDLKESSLGKIWRILSTSVDDAGLEYVSTVEHNTYPYYGVQWHPEKPLYEWGHYNIPHDKETVLVSQHTAYFFVNEARKNNHKFPSEEEERKYLIYNFEPTYGHATSTYTQLYFFD